MANLQKVTLAPAGEAKAPARVPLTPERWEVICERLMDGEALAKICRDADMPARRTVFKRLASDETMREEYEAARVIQADALADDQLDLADTATAENAPAVKVKVAARQWYADKLNPKKYGAKGN